MPLPIFTLALNATILIAAAAPLSNEPRQPESSPAPAAAPTAEPRKVCKSVTYTGSRLPGRKLCKTKEEWEALTENAQDGMRDRERSSRKWKP